MLRLGAWRTDMGNHSDRSFFDRPCDTMVPRYILARNNLPDRNNDHHRWDSSLYTWRTEEKLLSTEIEQKKVEYKRSIV